MRVHTVCKSRKGSSDTTPDPYTWFSQTNAEPSTLINSNIITVSGIDTATSIVSTNGEIQINGGAWVIAGLVVNGDTVRLRKTSSSSHNTLVTASTSIGGVESTFEVTTMSITYYLNWIRTGESVGGSIVGDTIYGGTSLSSWNSAMPSGLPVPKDGNWYYWEGYSNAVHSYNNVSAFTQTVAQNAAGTVAYHTQLTNSQTFEQTNNGSVGVRGVFARWNTTANYFVVGSIHPNGTIYYIGNCTTNLIYLYPCVRAKSQGGSTTLVLKASQMKFNPSGLVASLYPSTPAYNAYPTYPLVSG